MITKLARLSQGMLYYLPFLALAVSLRTFRYDFAAVFR